MSISEVVQKAVESGLYNDFINGKTDEQCVHLVVEDVLKSALLPETLRMAGVKVFCPLGYAEVKEKLNLDRDEDAINLYHNYTLIEFPYNSDYSRFKVLPALPDRKYTQAKGSYAIPYILPSVQEVKSKRHKPLWLTEGEKKTLCLIQNGEHCVGLSGVWNFKGGMEKDLWSDLKSFIWKSRTVYLAFDADLHEKPDVRSALYELSFKLHAKGAIVKMVVWDINVGKGIDDYLFKMADKKDAIQRLKDSAVGLTDFIIPDHKNEVLRGLAMTKFEEAHDGVIESVAERLRIKPKHLKKELEVLKRDIARKSFDMDKDDMNRQLQKACDWSYYVELPYGYVVKYNGLDIASNQPVRSTLYAVEFTDEGYELIELSKPFIVTTYISTQEGTKQVLRTARGKEVVVDVALSDPRTFDRDVVSPLLGVTLPRQKIQKLIDYVHDYQNANKDSIWHLRGMEKTGWNGDTFYLPSRKQSGVKWLEPRLESSLSLSTDRESAVNNGKKLLRYLLTTPAGIIILGALSAPLIKRLRVQNFILHASGLQHSGKSCIENFSLSIYGNPFELRNSWNSTPVGKELLASMYSDLPLWVEEFEEKRRSVEEFKEFSYQYVSGQGRIRGQKNLNLRQVKKYSGVLISSAEKDLDSVISMVDRNDTKKLGLYRRVIEVPADKATFLFPVMDKQYRTDEQTEAFIKSLYRFTETSYGWLGKEWVEYVESHLAVIQDIYNEMAGGVKDTGGSDSAFAVMITVLHSPFIKDIMAPEELSVAESILRNYAARQGERNREVRDIVSDFIEKALSYLMENSNKVEGLGGYDDKKAGLIGEVIEGKEDKKFDIFLTTNTFDTICRQFGFSKNILLEQLHKQHKLRKTDSKRYVYQHRMGRIKVTGYYIWEAFRDDPDDNAFAGSFLRPESKILGAV